MKSLKWLLFFLFALVGTGFFLTTATGAESTKPVGIESITYTTGSAKEEIIFKLSDSIQPKIFSIKGDKPRLVIDFYNSIYKGQNTIPVTGGKFATTIRTGMHATPKQKIRVVVDLTKEIPVQFSHAFSEEKKQLVVTFTPVLVQLPDEDTAITIEQEKEKKLPSQKELEARPLDEKPVPPVFSVKESTENSTPDTVVAPTPQILDITFDDTSNRGEMVLFRLNDFYPPTVSALEKGNPQVFCDFMDMKISPEVRESIVANGKYIQRIRTTEHTNPDKVRIVLDLTPDRGYDLQQVFFKNDNLFVLIVNELPAEDDAKLEKTN